MTERGRRSRERPRGFGAVARRAAGMLTGLLPLAACGGDSPSTLTPAGPGARRAESLWWLMFWISVVVVVVVAVLLLWVIVLRARERTKVRTGSGTRFVVVAGIVVPALILTCVYAVGLDAMTEERRPPGEPALTIEVIGHRWWWEVRYRGAVTANEIHVPADRTIRLRLTSADVNHSFWVPELTAKTDLIPGRTNTTWLRADRPGRYRGQCAEFCGVQHATMAFSVVAQPPEKFQAWLANQREPARRPVTAAQERGLRVLEGASCASCHTVRGTRADGDIGPDLTHLAGRERLGAGAIPNTDGHLAGWISNSQSIKPGNKMPPQPLEAQDLTALVRYLSSLE